MMLTGPLTRIPPAGLFRVYGLGAPKLLEGKSGQITRTPSCFLRSASNVELTVCV